VQGVHAVQDDACRARAGERGGDFLPDVPGFADADYDNFAPAFDGFNDNLDGAFNCARTFLSAAISMSKTSCAFARWFTGPRMRLMGN